jgi:hypothetical protein
MVEQRRARRLVPLKARPNNPVGDLVHAGFELL